MSSSMEIDGDSSAPLDQSLPPSLSDGVRSHEIDQNVNHVSNQETNRGCDTDTGESLSHAPGTRDILDSDDPNQHEENTKPSERKNSRGRKRGASFSREGNKKRRKIARASERQEYFENNAKDETNYIIENGMRWVKPYPYTYSVNVKGRWVGLKLIDMLCSEYQTHDRVYYERAIISGRIRVHDRLVSAEHVLLNTDLVQHRLHRHEAPTAAHRISIVYESDDLLVINKPPSLPVHPAGRYRHNTVIFVLAREYNQTNLFLIHRLDRLTSGLLIFGKTPEVARAFGIQIQDKTVVKQYLARVTGHFPDGVHDVNQPIEVAVKGRGVNAVSASGKSSRTLFERVGFDAASNSSLVKCRPISGRSHQIRVHLKFLGFVIVGDSLYGDVDVAAEYFERINRTRYARTDEEKDMDLYRASLDMEWVGKRKMDDIGSEELEKECLDCESMWNETNPEGMYMCLHAMSYQGQDWAFATQELPEWTSPFELTPAVRSSILVLENDPETAVPFKQT